jgi:hypothetical protein
LRARPKHQRQGDAVLPAGGDGVVDGGMPERGGNAFHLNPEFERVDAAGAIDRQNQGEVDFQRGVRCGHAAIIARRA